MRLHLIFFFVLFYFYSAILIAQGVDNLEFLMGPELEEGRGEVILETFGHSEDFFFCIKANRRKKGEFSIEKIDVDSLTILKSSRFAPKKLNGKVPVFLYPISTRDASFLIATAEDPGGTEIHIMAYRISDDLNIQGDPLIIGIAKRESLISENGFLLFKTAERDKIALFIPDESKPERNEKFKLRYFDSKFDLLEVKKIEIPYPSEDVFLEDAVLTPRGVFHGIISLREKTEVRVLPDSYALLTYNPAESGIKEKSLALGNKWFYDFKLSLTPDTNLWLAGYYSNMVEPSMAGTFSVVIDSNTGELLNTGLSPFERDFRLMFRSDLKNDEDDLGLFKLDQTYLRRDGNLSLINEKRYTRTSTIFNPATGTYSVIDIHYNEELLITTIQPRSKIVENILIPKYQSSSREFGRYLSYVSTSWNDKLLLFYNDHSRNVSLSPSQFDEYRWLNNDNNMTISYCLIKDGEVTKKYFDSEVIGGYSLNAAQHYRTEKSQVLTTYKGDQIRYIKVLIP